MEEIVINHQDVARNGIAFSNGIFVPDIIVRTIIVILLFYVITSFLLAMVRLMLNFRLKSKLIDRGVPVDEAVKLLRVGTESKDYAVKWCLILLSSALGFSLIRHQSFGWDSVAIVALCLALGFAVYYWYLRLRKETV